DDGLVTGDPARRVGEADPGAQVELPDVPGAGDDGVLAVVVLVEPLARHPRLQRREDAALAERATLVGAEVPQRVEAVADAEEPELAPARLDDQTAIVGDVVDSGDEMLSQGCTPPFRRLKRPSALPLN